MAHELDQKIQDLYKRIETQRSYIAASEKMRRATTNQEVLRRNDVQIRESQRSLSYFEETLRDLQARKAQTLQQPPQQQRRSDDSSGPGTSGRGVPTSPRKGGSSDRDRALPMPPSTSPDDYGVSQYQSYSPTSPELPRPKQYSNLDLIKAETPYTTAKITRMLEQLEFKLQVENQYKKAIQQMTRLYQADGDKKSRADADAKRIESDKKIQLLQTALKRYKNLHIIDDPQSAEEEQHPAEGDRKDNLRKPLSGKLYITIREARDLDHAPLLKRSSKVFNDTSVVLKVEGTARANSLPSRTDKWNQEFEISVEKANEVEVAIFDRQSGAGDGQSTPIGLLWLRLNDVVDALRRQRVGTEAQGAWVTAAGAMRDGHGPGGSPPHDTVYGQQQQQQMGFGGQPGPDAAPNQLGSEGITAWFAVEPAGALALDINFVKENVRRRPVDAGKLGRQGAVRMRPREVHEMNGHKFVARQFYQIMMCAYCSDFLLKASGYQCEDCRYTCHRECYPKVVTKCISKSNADTEADEDKINHRIPHRFETITNIRANWCCHCGYMLPLGRKNAKKCSECDITCHASCAHLVPDFCGMTMEKANALLHQIQEIKSHQKQMQPGKGRKPQSPSQSLSMSQQSPVTSPQQWGPPPQQDMYSDFNKMSIGGPPQGHGRTSSSASIGAGPGYPMVGGQIPPGMPPPLQQQQPPPLGKSSYDGSPYRPSMEMDGPGGLPPKPVRVDQYGRPIPDKQPTFPPPITQQQPDRPPSIVQQLPPQVQQQQQPEQHLPPARQPTIPKSHRKVGLDDFNFLAVLGKGNFGKVMLAEEKKTNGLYAIKVLKKEFIIDNDEVESTQSEKRVFLTAARERHPFLLGLHSCFQTETRVYFVMEYVSGGDLMLHIQRKQFSLRQAKFYAAEVLLALEYFHANGIIYRDLKLDNILLTLDGHVKVADYGLCKEEMGYGQTTGTFCGTPEFMAPEILLEQRYGRAVDWWAFGVLMYEMLLGQSPFRGDDEDEIFDAILEDEPLYPITMPRDAVSILQRLLTRDPNRRLGSGPNDAEDIKAHPFFKDTNFDDVFNKRIPPPYYPSISNSTDVSNFDSEFTREQPTLTPVHGQLSLADQNQFVGFSWVAAWADN